MKVFISWSDTRSRFLAECLRAWLPKVIQSVDPWMSEKDISAGSRWLPEVASQLDKCTVGILCVTPENQFKPWLLFEAGALSKTLLSSFVCPILYDIKPSQLQGPLTQFQSVLFNKEGVFNLLETINLALDQDKKSLRNEDLKEIFEVWWPKLNISLQDVPSQDQDQTPLRDASEIMEEILILQREQIRRENTRLEFLKKVDEKDEELVGFMRNYGDIIDQFFKVMPIQIQNQLTETVLFNEAGNNFRQISDVIEHKSEIYKAMAKEILEPPKSKK